MEKIVTQFIMNANNSSFPLANLSYAVAGDKVLSVQVLNQQMTVFANTSNTSSGTNNYFRSICEDVTSGFLPIIPSNNVIAFSNLGNSFNSPNNNTSIDVVTFQVTLQRD